MARDDAERTPRASTPKMQYLQTTDFECLPFQNRLKVLAFAFTSYSLSLGNSTANLLSYLSCLC